MELTRVSDLFYNVDITSDQDLYIIKEKTIKRTNSQEAN